MTSQNSQGELSKVFVAVIGDVGTDWSFIAGRPARPRPPSFQPWTQYPAAHLFALPGGAWFSGHAIQGALSSPRFTRDHSAQAVMATSSQQASHVVLKGTCPKSGVATAKLSLRIPVQAAKAQEPAECSYAIILDNDHEISLAALLSSTEADVVEIELTIAMDQLAACRNAEVQLGLTNAELEFIPEKGVEPGWIRGDQVARHFDATSITVNIPAGEPLLTTLIHISSKATAPLKLGTFKAVKFGSPTVLTALPIPTGVQSTCLSSLKVISNALRRGIVEPLPKLQLQSSDANVPITFDSGTIDVTYGEFKATTTTTDRGKFNPPSVQMPSPDQVRPLEVTLHNVADADLDVCHRLIVYSNPGPDLSAQHPGHVVHTLSEMKAFRRHEGQTRETNVFRRHSIHGIDGPSDGYPGILSHYRTLRCRNSNELTSDLWKQGSAPETPGGMRKIVVIDDEGLGFTGRHTLWAPFLYPTDILPLLPELYFEDFIEKLQTKTKKSAWIPSGGDASPPDSDDEIVPLLTARKYLAYTHVVLKASHWLNPPKAKIIRYLELTGALERSTLVISGECLRAGLVDPSDKPGVKLSRTMSWERTLTDFVTALGDARLKPVLNFKHILVRLGMEGAIHCRDANDPSKRKINLYFDPGRIEGEYAPDDLGQMPGLTTVFSSAITRELAASMKQGASPEDGFALFDDNMAKNVSYALQCCRRYFDLGYGPTPSTVRKFEQLQLPISQTFGRATVPACVDSGRHRFATHCFEPPKPGTSPNQYSILETFLQSQPLRGDANLRLFNNASDAPAVGRAIEALSLGRRIVLEGVKQAFKSAKTHFPYAQFNQLVTVDRSEMEGLRSIRKVLSEYISHDERAKPISIAVFGPPGSGKSFGVQQIAELVAPKKIREFTFNVAQFQSFEEISRLLLQVRDASLERKLPLVFFDEFDSQLNGQPLGWLKSFLAPMQDGRFQHEGQQMGIGKAVFVFAGGIAANHAEFVSTTFWNEKFPQKDGSGDVFVNAKGTDFHSRLRGYLDISSPNPLMTGRDEKCTGRCDAYTNESFMYVVRRALLMRQMIERFSLEASSRLLDQSKRVEVDSDVLDAFLMAESYSHGVRSIQAILEMCTIAKERVISKTLLPSQEQLEMHVDESFSNILTRQYSRLGSRIVEATLENARNESLDDVTTDFMRRKTEE